MNIELLTREQAVASWPVLEPMFQRAMDKGQGESTLVDYLQKILNYHAQCWAVYEDGVITGAGLTEILTYTQHKTLHIILFTGLETAVTPRIMELVDQFARDQGCIAQESWGRKGWAKMLPKQIPGFFEAYTVMRRLL